MADSITQISFSTNSSGKLTKTIEESGGKLLRDTTPTTTVTGTAIGVINTTTDSGTLAVDVSKTNLSILGGRNIATKVQDSKIYFDLATNISIAQATVTPAANTSPLIIKNSAGGTVFEITSDGVPKMLVRTNAPAAVTTGIIYASGLGSLSEGYYVGYLGASDVQAEEPGGGSVVT